MTTPHRIGRQMCFRVAKGKKREYKVGQTILVKLSGQIAEATIRAIIERTDGLHLQVDFGYEQTALIGEGLLT